MAKLTTYLVYRHGSNSANQSMRDKAPVAVVEATSRGAACEVESPDKPTIDSPACWLKRDRGIVAWNNQWFSALPASKAPAADLREVQEE